MENDKKQECEGKGAKRQVFHNFRAILEHSGAEKPSVPNTIWHLIKVQKQKNKTNEKKKNENKVTKRGTG